MDPASRIARFVPAAAPITGPVTKFGGQPVWLAEPAWPVNAAWDEPMRFVCQLGLEPVLGAAGRGKLAYVFVTHAEFGDDEFFDPDVIFPDEGANAVLVQPGGDYAGPTRKPRPTATESVAGSRSSRARTGRPTARGGCCCSSTPTSSRSS